MKFYITNFFRTNINYNTVMENPR